MFLKVAASVVMWILAVTIAAGETIRVASYNVRNYTGTDRVTGDGWTPDYPKPETEKDALRKTILAVRPDVIVFQEMGPKGYLEELRFDLAASGLDLPFSAYLEASDPERCLAALSRIPFEEVGRNASLTCRVDGQSIPVKRGLLSLTFVTRDKRWTLYDIHLKSRSGTKMEAEKNTAERKAEAAAIRDQILREQGENGMWLLAGDTNDIPKSGAWNRLLQKGERQLCVDVRPHDSRDEYWTYYYKALDRYERIDVILASNNLSGFVKPNTLGIYDGEGAMEGSDHRMIYTDMEIR